MKRIQIVLIVLMVSSFISSLVFAFDLSGGAKKSTSAVTMDDALKSQGALIESYDKGFKSNLQANAMMISALGDKEEAAKLNATADSFSAGTCDSECLEKNTEVTENAGKRRDELMSESKELSSEAKKEVSKSLIPLSKSVLYYKKASEKSKSCLDAAQSVIESASFTQKMSAKKKLDPVLTIAPRAPKDLASVGKTLKKYIDFANSHKVKVPKDATDALGSL